MAEFENRPEKRFNKVSRTHFVRVKEGVARGRDDLEAAQSSCFEPKPVAKVVETDRVRKLGKEHGSQVAQNAEGASHCVHPGFTGCLIEKASRYEVEKLLGKDPVGTGWFVVHTPTEWEGTECWGTFFQPTFFYLARYPCGMLVIPFHCEDDKAPA